MNKDKHMKKAQEFAKEKSAYIHCEVKSGDTQLGVSGDPLAIIYGCYCTIKRLTELTGVPFQIIIETLEDFYNVDNKTDIREV